MNDENLTNIGDRPDHKELAAKGGRNKRGSISLTSILKKYLDKQIDWEDPITKKKIKKRIGDIINLALLKKALEGDIKAIEMAFDRTEGKPLAKHAVSGGIDLKSLLGGENGDIPEVG